jgi:radical SAM superfamily enzyme YgiQ (UPF0313 family)
LKILLIKPKWFVRGGIYRYLEKIKFTPLHLGILAALSEGHDVRVVDGDYEEIPYDLPFDLVGITVTTFTSQVSYAIARRFRAQGIPVVMGGVHPSILPDECRQHADAVVVGEAEYVWPELLRDAERRQLRPLYRSDRLTDLADVPFPKRALLNEQSWFAAMQVSRGCPYSCKYCYLPNVPWHAHRRHAIPRVHEELSALPQPMVYFVDDNFFADEPYVLALSRTIAPLKKKWSVQAPTTIVNNEKLVQTVAEAGCFNMQIGFQTVNSASLDWASVRQNRVAKYRELVAMLHRYRILATGFFIFGFDTDDRNIFHDTVSVIQEMDLDEAHLYILTPYPGTPLYEQFQREGRLLDGKDRSNFGWANAVFQPKRMTPEELEQGVQQAYQNLYPFFRSKLPKAILTRLPWLIRYPSLIRTLISGGTAKVHLQ